MDEDIFTVGEATYELSRFFLGREPLTELLARRLNLPAAGGVDGSGSAGYNQTVGRFEQGRQE